MKHFMIKYSLKEGSREAWHDAIAQFIAALESDPAVRGKIAYRCMQAKNSAEYFHLAAAADDAAIKALQANAFFARYTDETKRISGGTVEVVPLDIIAETAFRA
jgi:hypothetical protein